MSDITPYVPRDDRITNANSDDHLIALWLRSKAVSSKEAYSRDISQFLLFTGVELTTAKLDDIWSWLDHLEGEGLAVSSRARKLASVKSLFSFGHKVGYLSFNVGAAISLPKIPDMLAQRILTENEVQDILHTADSERNSVLLRLFYSTGARVSELVTLNWEHVQEKKIPGSPSECIITLIGKGSKTRNVLVPASIWSILINLRSAEQHAGFGSLKDPVIRSAKGGPLSRPQIWRIVRKAARMAGVDRAVSPHWLRHAHASHSLDHGAPTHLVKETLGHKSLTTTSRYSHARPDDSSGKYLDV